MTHALAAAPRLGITGERLAELDVALSATIEETATLFETSRAAIIVAMLGMLTAAAARIDRAGASDLLHALAARVRNPAAESELDQRRIDKAAAALFEADQRRPQR